MTGLSSASTIAGVLYCCWRRWAASRQEPTGAFRRPGPPRRPWQHTQRRRPSVELFVDESFNNVLSARNSSSSEENFHESVSVEMEEVV